MTRIHFKILAISLLVIISLIIWKNQKDKFQLSDLIPHYKSLENIKGLHERIAEIIGSKNYKFSTRFDQTEDIRKNTIIVELANPKLFPYNDKEMTQYVYDIKKECVKFIDNIDKFNEVILVLKWPEKNLEKQKSISVNL